MFTDFDGNRVTRVFGGGTVSMVGCAFDHNTLFEEDSGAAIIQADGEIEKGGMQVRLDGCTFTNNTLNALPTLLAENRGALANATAAFFSDAEEPDVCVFEGPDLATGVPDCVNSAPLPLDEAGDGFLSDDDEWLEETQLVRSQLACVRSRHGACQWHAPHMVGGPPASCSHRENRQVLHCALQLDFGVSSSVQKASYCYMLLCQVSNQVLLTAQSGSRSDTVHRMPCNKLQAFIGTPSR